MCSYKELLLRLRAEEQRQGGDATIAFLLQVAAARCCSLLLSASVLSPPPVCLQVEDIQFLVEDVWTFCSAKESSELDGLDLVRWDRRRAWSPWNCILLPRAETDSHLEVEHLGQVGCSHSTRPHPPPPASLRVENTENFFFMVLLADFCVRACVRAGLRGRLHPQC